MTSANPGTIPEKAMLAGLTDDELVARVDRLVDQERAMSVRLLDHLGEIDRRELYLGLGYASLFDYCSRRLRYSASAANRRIRTARALRRYPRTRRMLLDGRVNLSSIAKVSRVLSADNAVELLRRVAGKSCREVDAIVESLRPGPAVRDRVKPVAVLRNATAATSLPGLAPAGRSEAVSARECDAKSGPTGPASVSRDSVSAQPANSRPPTVDEMDSSRG